MDSIVSLVGAGGTLVAIATSLFLLAQGQRDRRAAAESQRREQARKVTCWVAWTADWKGASLAQPRAPEVRIRNSSDAAVYEVFVDLASPVDGQTIRADIGVVGPGDTGTWTYEDPFDTSPGWVPDALLPRLYFRDANGDSWRRNARGVLHHDPGPSLDEPVRQLPRQH